MGKDDALAWVESPLQLVGAAEWAHAHRTTVPVAGRLTEQMSATAEELVARRAPFDRLEPYLGIPWGLLARHGHWLVGDGFSGQFRLAAAVLRPRRISFLDDGSQVLSYADALLGDRAYSRPAIAEGRLSTALAPFALERVRRRAAARSADFFTAFDFGEQRADRLRDRGFGIERHDFAWTRASAPAKLDSARRVILGSAQPVDGRMLLVDYVRWVRLAAASGPSIYLPHRRETPEQLDAVASIANIAVQRTELPVELYLAGSAGPLDLHTLASSTTTTLPLVLSGSAFTIHIGRPRRSRIEEHA